MIETEQTKNELEQQLERVKNRILMLDMIKEKLLKLENIAQKVAAEDLVQEDTLKINKQVQKLIEQIAFLANDSTGLS